MEGLAKTAAKTYSRKNLRVNTVSPGLVDTPLAKKITENPIILKASIKMLALDKIGKPKQISNIIKFLINPENDWVTGQNFIVDGGLSSTSKGNTMKKPALRKNRFAPVEFKETNWTKVQKILANIFLEESL